ncbi:hypothetical protein CHL76_13715 [Marinococcus halophilus]|uniref:Beta-xylanase n=1 Tax=Marinococcus halophilus TaxID=1371 RepID=A0A510Y8P7_MARHA|nr:endo-1,4-beta-xylanase [Marinococcus halophilus]OZT79200.1 hypothetical protein CHL76_13715 [Marinococcus halophilus]GEK59758.1 beta-xylanase [Marinococcus halophilus]
MKSNASLGKNAEETGHYLGASVRWDPLTENEKYESLLVEEFSSVTVENEMKMDAAHPAPEEYNFQKADEIVQAAEQNNMKVRGHPLVWGEALPEWVYETVVDEQSARKVLKDHVQTMAGHYRERVNEWDVVNEAWNDDGSYRETIWLEHIGPEYIPLAFEWAREAAPEAKLYYNDYGNEMTNEKTEAMFAALKRWKDEGVPIDGIGMQTHIDAADPRFSKEKMQKNLRRWGAEGFETAVTELDVKLQNLDASREERLEKQADIYADVTSACMEEPSCKGLTVWGVGDTESWVTEQEAASGEPLLFDSSWKAKPAYERIKRTFIFNQML